MKKEEFIEKAKQIYGDRYDYSLVNYKNIKTNVKIKCNTCNYIFEKSPQHFLEGIGCPVCNQTTKINTEIFVLKAKRKGLIDYDYSKVDYKNQKSKINIYCEKCKKWINIAPHDFLNRGCGHKFLSQEVFIEKLKEINNDYDFSEVKFVDYRTKIKIKCKFCGKIKYIMPGDFMKGKKCLCRMTNFNFIKDAKKIHGDKYDYSLVNYKNNKTNVKIKCKKCGLIFEQIPKTHLRGSGCPVCSISVGEEKISFVLRSKNINFKLHKTFPDLKDKWFLSYDFYLPDYNLLIEYNGIQHYEPVKHFGGYQRFLIQKHHDWLKRKYARDNGYNFLTISYKDDIINILKEFLYGKKQ